jgi:hypothetical protein
MVQCTKMINGVGFYIDSESGDHVPSFADCRKIVADAAYFKAKDSGSPPNKEWDFWLAAERELFGGFRVDGYDIFVCDLSRRENKGFMRHFDMIHVSPDGTKRISR